MYSKIPALATIAPDPARFTFKTSSAQYMASLVSTVSRALTVTVIAISPSFFAALK